MSYTADARKVLAKATPTVDTEGNVVKWEVEGRYSLNGYHSTYRHEFDADVLKPVSDWTKAELWAEMPTAQWDMVFESQYQSVVVDGPTAPVRKSDFDIRKMK